MAQRQLTFFERRWFYWVVEPFWCQNFGSGPRSHPCGTPTSPSRSWCLHCKWPAVRELYISHTRSVCLKWSVLTDSRVEKLHFWPHSKYTFPGKHFKLSQLSITVFSSSKSLFAKVQFLSRNLCNNLPWVISGVSAYAEHTKLSSNAERRILEVMKNFGECSLLRNRFLRFPFGKSQLAWNRFGSTSRKIVN